jgi:excisionase family DNA binding protein
MTSRRIENMDPLLNAEEVGAVLGISKSKTYALFSQGELPVVRLGRAVRVRASALEAFIQRHTAAA